MLSGCMGGIDRKSLSGVLKWYIPSSVSSEGLFLFLSNQMSDFYFCLDGWVVLKIGIFFCLIR